MVRPKKYTNETERLEARREQWRKANKKRKNNINNNNSNSSNNNINNKNYKLLYELLKIEHEELKEHNKVNEEFIEELQKKVRELENKDEGEWW
jgi:hypothetical protein